MSDFELPTIKGEQDAKDLEAKYAKKELILPNQRAIDEFGGKKYTEYSKYEPGEHAVDPSKASLKLIKEQAEKGESLSDIANTAIQGIQKQLNVLRSALKSENKYPSGNDKVKSDLEAKIAKLENDLKQFSVVSSTEIPSEPAIETNTSTRNPTLDPENVAKLKVELAENREDYPEQSDDTDIDAPTIIVSPDKATLNTNAGDIDIHKVPVARDFTQTEPMPTNPTERSGWFRRNRNKLLAGAAVFAIGLGSGWALVGGKDNKKDTERGSTDKAEQPVPKPAPNNKSQGDPTKNLKFSQNFSNKNHSGNKVNAWGTERSLLVENAPLGTLDGEARNEYIDNHDKITAANVEKLVNVRFQEMYGLDAAKFNSAWGQEKREEMKRKYLSDSGHSLSKSGQEAHALHLKEMRSGKIIKMTATEAASKYDLDVNSYIKEGKLKGGIDDLAYAKGKTHDEIYIMFDKNGNIEHAEIGNCGNEVFSIKGSFTPNNPTPNTPPPTTDTPPPPDYSKKPEETPSSRDNGDNNVGKGEKTTNQDLGSNTPGGNTTNPTPAEIPRSEPALPVEPNSQPGTAPTGPSK